MRWAVSTAGNNAGDFQSSSVRDHYGHPARRCKAVPSDPETPTASLNWTADTIEQKLRRSRIMTKYLPITLGLAAFVAANVTPALARNVHYSAAQAARQMALYAIPDGPRVAGPLPPTAVTVNGEVVGNDPDPQIRLSLAREFYFNK
jgi:hypothetical protein